MRTRRQLMADCCIRRYGIGGGLGRREFGKSVDWLLTGKEKK